MVRYGTSCERCKAYFVTDDRRQRKCPWCQKVIAGAPQPEFVEVLEL